MAMEEDTTTTRRLRVRTSKPIASLLEKDGKDVSPLGQKLSSSSKRKAEITLESLYLQKNYKDPSSTPLETIFESPRPSKGVQQGRASPDAALLMANRKLKRLCIFSSHHQLPRNKLKHRKERALKMKRLTGVQVPLGKAFTEDDVLAVLSCLAEDETAIPSMCQEQEKEVSDLPNTSTPALMEGMISVLNSLQMNSNPSLAPSGQEHVEAASTQPQCSKEKGPKHRCDMIPQATIGSPSTPTASLSIHQSPSKSQPSKTVTRMKTLKWRSGLVFPQKSSSSLPPPSDPEAVTSIHPPQSCPRKASRAKWREKDRLAEVEEHSTSTKVPHLSLGSKRTPDSTLTTSAKKHCIHESPQETNLDPSPLPQHSKGRAKGQKWEVSRVKHHNSPALETPTNNTLDSIIVPISVEQNAVSLLPEASSSLPSPPLPSPNKRGLSPTPICPLIAFGGTANNGDGKRERGITKEGGTSPSSPSSRLAALSLHSSPTQLSPPVKPRKIRRRSARLSIGPDVIEGVQQIQNNNSNGIDVPLGTVWAPFSPIKQRTEEKRTGKSSDDADNGPLPPQPSTATTKKKGQSKGRRRSNLYSHLEIMDAMGESAIITTTKSTLDVPNFFQQITPSPVSLHSPSQVPVRLTVEKGSPTTVHNHDTPST